MGRQRAECEQPHGTVSRKELSVGDLEASENQANKPADKY